MEQLRLLENVIACGRHEVRWVGGYKRHAGLEFAPLEQLELGL